MDMTTVTYNILALVFSLIAIIISAVSALRQTSDVRRSNLMLYMTEKGEFYRSKAYRNAHDYIITELSQFDPAVVGVYGLPEPAIDYVLLVGGFYQDIGTLVGTRVIQEDWAAALYYTGIKEMWHALEPYIQGERERRRAKALGNFWGSFEAIAAYVDSVLHEKVRRKFLHRRFSALSVGLVKPSGQLNGAATTNIEHSDP
jgi:hypothetical protein